jgi:DNA invertase Pin-like site-specific DNA recombinase
MAKIGYILTATDFTNCEADAKWMTDFGCSEIVREEVADNAKARILWDSLIGRIRKNDTLVISKLSNALRGVHQLIFFLEFCRMNCIRLISIHDRIDSGDELFPEANTGDILTAIALLPKEANAVRKSGRHIRRVRAQVASMTKKAAAKAERNKRIVNMYLQGYAIEDILTESGFTSRSSVFRILRAAEVELTRSRTRPVPLTT